MRVLQVVEAANAGVGRHVLDLCSGLVSRGIEVHLAYSPRRADHMFTERLSELEGVVTCIELPIRRRPHIGDIGVLLSLRKHLREQGPFDLIHGHSSKGGALARLASIGSGLPAVYTPNAIRTLHPDIGRVHRLLVRWVEKALAKVPGAIVAVSPEEQEHLVSLGIPRQKTLLIPNGIASVSLPSREEARRKLGLDRESVVVGFVGRFSAQKAPQFLLDSFAQIAGEFPELRLVMVGWGELEPELHRSANEKGICERVDWLGERPGQVSMPAFDLLALPSRYEGMAYVLLEAILAGLPIVASRCPGVSMVVEHGVNGSVVEQGRVDQFAQSLRELAGSKELRSRYGAVSREKAVNFSLERMQGSTFDLYTQLGVEDLDDS